MTFAVSTLDLGGEQETRLANDSEQNLPGRQSRLLASFSVTHTCFIDHASCSQADLPPSPNAGITRLHHVQLSYWLLRLTSELVSLPMAR